MKRAARKIVKKAARKTKPVRKPPRLKIVHRAPIKEQTMANPEPKASPPTIELAQVPINSAHKNQPIGPATGRLLADWSRHRDYEQFNPTPEK
jgi:hypothetical protein